MNRFETGTCMVAIPLREKKPIIYLTQKLIPFQQTTSVEPTDDEVSFIKKYKEVFSQFKQEKDITWDEYNKAANLVYKKRVPKITEI